MCDKTAWQGSITGNTETYINKPDLFGGEGKEDGIQDDLAEPSRLAAMLGCLVSAFCGVVTLFYDGQVCAMSLYPKSWAARGNRELQGWHNGQFWYPEKVCILMSDGVSWSSIV